MVMMNSPVERKHITDHPQLFTPKVEQRSFSCVVDAAINLDSLNFGKLYR